MRTAHTLTRIAVAATVAALALSACSSTKSDTSTKSLSADQLAAELAKPATLTMWTWVSGMDEEVALFEKKYPNIKVNVVNGGQGGAEYTKLRTALTAGKDAPDLAQIEYQEVPAFATTGDLLDLTPYGANGIKDKFVGWTWSQVALDGKVYAIPQDTGPMGMLYRADIFQQYGID